MRDIDALLKAGNKAQREKLEENRHKGGFDIDDLFITYEKLVAEVYELKEELYTELTPKKEIDYVKAKREAADVANFAHMIILKCDNILNEEGEK